MRNTSKEYRALSHTKNDKNFLDERNEQWGTPYISRIYKQRCHGPVLKKKNVDDVDGKDWMEEKHWE